MAEMQSLMLDAKNHRRRAETDLQLLANRLSHLQVAEERARKKIIETKTRTTEIISLKKRNINHQSSRVHLVSERKDDVSACKRAVSVTRVAQRRQMIASREVRDHQRKVDADKQRVGIREMKEYAGRESKFALDRNRDNYELARKARDEVKRRRDALRDEMERKRQEEYAQRVSIETARSQEAELMIQQMALQEQKMIQRLRHTQDEQRAAYEALQNSLQL